MERFIFVAAIVFAVIFGLVAMVGGGRHFHFDVDGRTDPVMPVAAGHTAAQTYRARKLTVQFLSVLLNSKSNQSCRYGFPTLVRRLLFA